jgi:hypothetical protein
VIGPAWQLLNIAMSKVTASAHWYCDICVKIWRLPFTPLHKKRLPT